MQAEVQSGGSEASQYSLVKAMIAAADRFREHTVVQRNLSFCTLRRLLKEGYTIVRKGRGGTSFLLIIW